jgi:hypothetical protein
MLMSGSNHLLSRSPERGNLSNEILWPNPASGGRRLASGEYGQP